MMSKKPFFTNKRICNCKLSKNSVSSDVLEIEITFSEDKSADITGIIYSNILVTKELAELLNFRQNLDFETVPLADFHPYFKSKSAFIKSFQRNDERYISNIELTFKDLTQIQKLPQAQPKRFTAKYYLPDINSLNYLINVEHKRKSNKFHFDFGKVKAKVFIEEVTDHESLNNESIRLNKFLYGIKFYDVSEDAFINKELFLNYVNTLVNSFLILLSLHRGFQIRWFKYIVDSGSEYETYYDSSDNIQQTESRINQLIDHYKIDKFLQENTLKLLNEDSIYNKLYAPIAFYLFGLEAPFLQQQYIIVYIALENLCKVLAEELNISGNLAKEKYKLLKKRIEIEIKNLNFSECEKQNINEKIVELQRAPMKYIFEQVFRYYNIDISNCYNQNGNLSFLSIRNQITHDIFKTSYNEIILNEFYKMRKYFEFLILKVLKWDGQINTWHFSSYMKI